MNKQFFHFRHKQQKKVFQGSSFHGQISGKESIRIVPIGGSGNVTKTCLHMSFGMMDLFAIFYSVDCGIGFPDADMYGVDLVIPDTRYLADKKQYIRDLYLLMDMMTI